jgi:hypothetical protein
MLKPSRPVYVTARCGETGKSKTITIYGLSIVQILALVKAAVTRP